MNLLRINKRLFLLLFVLSTYSVAYAQKFNYENLIFEGAGIRGIAYAGVIKVLEQEQIMPQIKKVGGTSAGAITALMVAIGYTADEIETIIAATKFQKFNDGQYFFIGGLSRVNKRYGWYRGERFTQWLETLIEQKTGNKEITFAQMHENGYKDLYVTATSLSQQKMVVLSADNFPNMKVKDAIRISMSIPLYFQAVFIDSMGNIYRKPIRGKALDVMVDGGIVGNFPIQIFDTVAIDDHQKEYRIANPKTLGVRIDSDAQIKNDTIDQKLAPYEIEKFSDYIGSFYTIIIENLNRHSLTKEDWSRTISVSSVGIGSKIRKLSQEEKNRLVQSGTQNTMRFLNP